MKIFVFPLLLSLLSISPLFADSGSKPADPAVVKKIERVMTRVMPNFKVESVTPSVFEGLYTVKVKNGPTLLSTADAGYFISGDVYTTANGKIENVSELERKNERLSRVESFSSEQLIVFSPESGAKRWIAVFTDVQCGYCRKFHADVPELNRMGVEVRYFSYPIFDGSRDNMVSALCAKDPRKALTTLKTGGTIPSITCDSQNIDEQFALAREFGINGTPAIMLDDGTLLKGYVKPDQLASQMGL